MYDGRCSFLTVLALILLVQADDAFGAQHGCKPMGAKLPYQWPFALDLLKRQYDANKTQRLLAFQTPYFDKLGPNIELRLFGAVGYLTFDPKNLEAILSTKFEGLLPKSGNLALKMANHLPRLRTWIPEPCSTVLSGRRYLHTGWTPLEAFTRAAPTTFCTHAVSKPCGFWRADR